MPGMPAMPAMPAFPNLSAGGGGPSSAQGSAAGTGGYDGSNWAVNFSGTQSTDQTSQLRPQASTYQAGPFGMPQQYSYDPMHAVAPTSAGGLMVSPTVLLGVAVVGLLLLRRRH